MTAPRRVFCVMQKQRRQPTQFYSQAKSSDINAPARRVFFLLLFLCPHKEKVEEKIKVIKTSIEVKSVGNVSGSACPLFGKEGGSLNSKQNRKRLWRNRFCRKRRLCD